MAEIQIHSNYLMLPSFLSSFFLILFCQSIQGQVADIILHNGSIITMEEDFTPVNALAIADGKILSYGPTEEMVKYTTSSTRMVNLNGLTVLPGIVDPHNHIFTDARQVLDSTLTLDDRQALLLETGITCMGDPNTESWNLTLIQKFAASGKMKIKTNVYMIRNHACNWDVDFNYNDYPMTEDKNALLRIAGIKIFTDGGSCGTLPATTFAYPGGGMGDLFLTDEQLTEWIQEADQKDYQVVIHAQGDRAIDQAQKSLVNLIKNRKNPLRHRIDHNAFLNSKVIDRYNEINIPVACFAYFPTCLADQTTYLQDTYGSANLPKLEDWRTLIDANPDIPIAWHSDAPLLEYHLPKIMHSYVTRKEINESGEICNPPSWLAAHAITIKEVVKMMTIDAAYLLHRDDQVGSLKPGKSADLIILSDNPLTIPSDELINLSVLMTMIDGEPVYCSPDHQNLCDEITTTTNNNLLRASTFSLGNVYPNPSTNENLFINLYLDQPMKTSFVVYDIRGKSIFHSKRKFLASGEHTISLSDIPVQGNGIWFIKFEIGSYPKIRVLVR